MADGHLNKCKECTKKDVHLNYEIKSDNEEWVESERERGREKYNRLGYKDIYKPKKYQESSAYKNLTRNIGKLFDLNGKELHHWNYNIINSFFILSRKAHKMIHKFIYVNEDDFCTYLKSDNTKIENEQMAIEITRKILIENGFENEDFELHNAA